MGTDNEFITNAYMRGVLNEDIENYNTSPLSRSELEWMIRDAIIEEQNAVKLYENMAIRTGNQSFKKMLQDIANEEKVHIGELQELLELVSLEEEDLVHKGRKEATGLLKNWEEYEKRK